MPALIPTLAPLPWERPGTYCTGTIIVTVQHSTFVQWLDLLHLLICGYMFRQYCHLQANININLINHLSCASSYCSSLLTRIGIPLHYNKTVPVL
jgi:hypothetical protein